MIEYIGTITGILGVYLSIKQKISAWPTFIICYSSYIYLAFQANLLANMSLNIIFVFISLYGWWNWQNKKGSDNLKDKEAIRVLPWRKIYICLGFCLFGTILLSAYLSKHNSFLPYLDSLATVTAICAQWMLSKKYIQTWIFWLISDVIFLFLWAMQGFTVTTILYICFIILAFWGLINWNKTMQEVKKT